MPCCIQPSIQRILQQHPLGGMLCVISHLRLGQKHGRGQISFMIRPPTVLVHPIRLTIGHRVEPSQYLWLLEEGFATKFPLRVVYGQGWDLHAGYQRVGGNDLVPHGRIGRRERRTLRRHVLLRQRHQPRGVFAVDFDSIGGPLGVVVMAGILKVRQMRAAVRQTIIVLDAHNHVVRVDGRVGPYPVRPEPRGVVGGPVRFGKSHGGRPRRLDLGGVELGGEGGWQVDGDEGQWSGCRAARQGVDEVGGETDVVKGYNRRGGIGRGSDQSLECQAQRRNVCFGSDEGGYGRVGCR